MPMPKTAAGNTLLMQDCQRVLALFCVLLPSGVPNAMTKKQPASSSSTGPPEGSLHDSFGKMRLTGTDIGTGSLQKVRARGHRILLDAPTCFHQCTALHGNGAGRAC